MTGPSPATVIAVGNSYRRDDGVGPAASVLVRRALPGVDVVELDGEPTRVIDAWAGRELAIVIDAVRGGGAPGSIHRIDTAVDPLPGGRAHGSTHRAGLAEAVALGRALDRLPARLVVFGVEPADLTDGEGLSPAVQRALPALAEQIVAEVSGRCA